MNTRVNCLFTIIAFLITTNCTSPTSSVADDKTDSSTNEMQSTLAIQKRPFGQIGDTIIHQFILKNANGMEVRIIEFGGIITHLFVPDKDGELVDVVLGFDELEKYKGRHPYFGAIIGRYGNRIADSQFELEGKTYQLTTNESPHHLHGGKVGFDKRIWESEIIKTEDQVGVQLKYTDPDGEQGYPGELSTTVTYLLENDNSLSIQYEATTTKPTPVNLTNHSYFNLNGAGREGVLNHELQITANRIIAVNEKLIPTGYLMPVEGTAFDFRAPKTIGAGISSDHPQMNPKVGYDHSFEFSESLEDRKIGKLATAYSPTTGIAMNVWTNEPAVQLYVANYTDGQVIEGKNEQLYQDRAAFCLETQHFPDSPNEERFPSTILYPDDKYKSETIYAFGVK